MDSGKQPSQETVFLKDSVRLVDVVLLLAEELDCTDGEASDLFTDLVPKHAITVFDGQSSGIPVPLGRQKSQDIIYEAYNEHWVAQWESFKPTDDVTVCGVGIEYILFKRSDLQKLDTLKSAVDRAPRGDEPLYRRPQRKYRIHAPSSSPQLAPVLAVSEDSQKGLTLSTNDQVVPVNISRVAVDLLEELNWFGSDVLKVPDSVLSESGGLGFSLIMYEGEEAYRALSPEDENKLKQARSKFNELCARVPHVPPEVLKAYFGAYAVFSVAVDPRSPDPSPQDQLKTLMSAAMLQGAAGALFNYHHPDQELPVAHFQKAMLAAAGKKGGKKRHEKTEQLKAWALERAATMKDADSKIARKLEQQIPENMRDASKAPSRLIYEALRAARTSKT